MATTIHTPVEEYLAKTWRPDREYIDGEIVERNLGESKHAVLQTAISAWLWSRRRKWNVSVRVEQRVQVHATRFRVPDVCVLSGDDPDEEIVTHPPLICIEVLSKDDSLRSMKERVTDYVNFGVRNIWLCEPEGREVWVCTADSMTRVTWDVLAASGTEISVPLDEIWADLD